MKRILDLLMCGLVAAAVSLFAGNGNAFPDRLTRIVVPYPAGGGVDLIARALANLLAQRWGQPVIVENRPGGSSVIGASAVARATPDGYTLLLTTDATITSNPHLFRQLSFDPMKDLVPLAHIVDLNLIAVINPKVRATSMRELVALAKSGREPLNFSSAGNGSQAHLMFESFNRVNGIQILHIPYSGIAPALQAAVAGEVQATLAGGTSLGFIQSGMLRPLAVSGEKRIPSMPEIPTLREAGFPEVDPRGWVGLFAPVGLAPELAEKIESEVRAVLIDSEFQRTVLQNIAFSAPADPSSKAFAQFLQKDFAFKKELVEKAGVKLD